MTTQGRKEAEIGTLLLVNDKNNVIVHYSLSCFFCSEAFGTKWLSKGLSKIKDK